MTKENVALTRWENSVSRKFSISVEDIGYFVSYELGYFDALAKATMSNKELDVLMRAALEAAKKYVDSLEVKP